MYEEFRAKDDISDEKDAVDKSSRRDACWNMGAGRYPEISCEQSFGHNGPIGCLVHIPR